MADTLITGTVQTLTDDWFADRNPNWARPEREYLVVPLANSKSVREAIGRERFDGKTWPNPPNVVGPGKQGDPARRGTWHYVDFEVSDDGLLAAFPHDSIVQDMIGKTRTTDGTEKAEKGT